MPGFLMGILQFGRLGVNTSSRPSAGERPVRRGSSIPSACSGRRGRRSSGSAIQYVAKVATYLPIILLVVLLIGLSLFGIGT
ncbi:MAG: hypothetical protein U0790_23520 [Isosphaeraceae bacterium]